MEKVLLNPLWPPTGQNMRWNPLSSIHLLTFLLWAWFITSSLTHPSSGDHGTFKQLEEKSLEAVLYSIKIFAASSETFNQALQSSFFAVVLHNRAPSGHQVILSQIIRAYQFHTKLSQTSRTRQSPMHHEYLTHITHHLAFSKTTLSKHIINSTRLTGQQWKSGYGCKMFYW